MYLENHDLQQDILTREQAQQAHWYLRKLREVFRAKGHERSTTGAVFHKASRNRSMAQSLAGFLEKEYGIRYIDSSFEEEGDA
tara:strand:- start:275 stop:523 length:249 start_codon:yes stop_codon:yes gene_type:complete